MIINDLKQLVKCGESDSLEFKQSTGQRSRGVETLCAMLNGKGGSLIFGVMDDGKLIGQNVSDSTLRDLARELMYITPAVVPDIDVVAVNKDNSLSVIVITVPGSGGPYCYKRRPYMRLSSSTVIMSQDLYELKIAEKLHSTVRWENQPVSDSITVDSFDKSSILETVRVAQSLGRLGEIPSGNLEDILVGLDLMQPDGKLLNAAIALFADKEKVNLAYYPQLAVRLARFRGVDRLADFEDNRDYWGGIFDLLKHSERFLREHIRIPGKVVAIKIQREDSPAYPLRATREALANAFCHRDYTCIGGAVEVAMYDNHLEITNPGSFHFGLTAEQLSRPHASRPWNPIIASVLHRAGVIEKWGSGTINIIRWCKEGETASPIWQQRTDDTICVTFNINTPHDAEHGGENVTPHDTPHVVKFLSEIVGEMSRDEIMKKMGVVDKKHFRISCLTPSLEGGYAEMSIPDKPKSKNQKYKLTEKGISLLSSKDISKYTVFTPHDVEHEGENVTPHDTPYDTPHVVKFLSEIVGEMSRDEIMKKMGVVDKKHFRISCLTPSLEGGYVEMSIPDKPKSKNQKYKLTEKGISLLSSKDISKYTVFTPHDVEHGGENVTPHDTPHVVNLLFDIVGEMSRDEIMVKMGLKDRKSFSETYLTPSLEGGYVEMTISDKPRSKKQKYRLTEKGLKVKRRNFE